MKKNLYQKAHEDISAIIAETKARKRWEDKDIGMVLDIKASSVSDHFLIAYSAMLFAPLSILTSSLEFSFRFPYTISTGLARLSTEEEKQKTVWTVKHIMYGTK